MTIVAFYHSFFVSANEARHASGKIWNKLRSNWMPDWIEILFKSSYVPNGLDYKLQRWFFQQMSPCSLSIAVCWRLLSITFPKTFLMLLVDSSPIEDISHIFSNWKCLVIVQVSSPMGQKKTAETMFYMRNQNWREKTAITGWHLGIATSSPFFRWRFFKFLFLFLAIHLGTHGYRHLCCR